MDPTAENILIFVRDSLKRALPVNIVLQKIELYETRNSYAEWQNEI
jgi:6-pyruvoyltetrahydropterin/6-carboxytetrahydropterin synthase